MAFYQDEPYEDHPFFSYESTREALRRVPRFRRFEQALEVLESKIGMGRLLDVGCGAGTFMSIAQSRGWDVHGVELCEPLCVAAEQAVGADRVARLAFEALPKPHRLYDAITMWDVIEHVLDPAAFVAKARAMVRPGGIVVVCTPDEESLLARTGQALYRVSRGRYSYPALALHPRYHTYFLSGTSLGAIFARHDMKVVESYSQAAFATHSELASRAQKAAISMVERAAAIRDKRYERVIFAQK